MPMFMLFVKTLHIVKGKFAGHSGSEKIRSILTCGRFILEAEICFH